MLLAAKILVSVAVVGFAVVPAIADLNRTHATNPAWTAHARYHVVWQSSSYVALGLVALLLLWLPGGGRQGLLAAAAIACCVYAGFFVAALTRPVYGGRLRDPNGHQPLRRGSRELDQNLLLFVPLVLILAAGAALALAA